MSNHNIEINFDTLKYNLYDILGVKSDASKKKIKKAFRTLILKFHPDKNNIDDEDIYNHLTLANEILTDENLKNKYDNWLKSFDVPITHEDLKSKYNPDIKIDTTESFDQINDELNKKHRFNPLDIDKPTEPKLLEEQIDEFNNMDLSIQKEEDIKSTEDFNNKFKNKKLNGEFENQLIEVNKKLEIMELNQTDTGSDFLSITHYDMLYDNNGMDTNSYSSIDQSFSLLPSEQDLTTECTRNRESYESYMESYKDEGTNILKDISHSKLPPPIDTKSKF